jgi:CheY-like chemotaxis protein
MAPWPAARRPGGFPFMAVRPRSWRFAAVRGGSRLFVTIHACSWPFTAVRRRSRLSVAVRGCSCRLEIEGNKASPFRALCSSASPVAAPHLVVMDASLPGIDGVDVCRRLKANPATSEVAVVLAGAHVTPQFEEAARKAGARSAVRKPIDVAVLLEEIGVGLGG